MRPDIGRGEFGNIVDDFDDPQFKQIISEAKRNRELKRVESIGDMDKYVEVFEEKKSLRERLGDIRNIKKRLMKKAPSIGDFDNIESSNKLN